MLALDTPNLQKETIALLESSKSFLSKITGTQNCVQQIEKQQELVETLELRMSVIAPMKAGKSTIINAIVGQELVPSHSFAMTTLPTELVINNQLTTPELHIPESTTQILIDLTQQIQQKIEQQGIEWAYEQTKTYDHLKDLVTELAQGITIHAHITGYINIQKQLEKMNHISRLAARLTPENDWIISDLPRIETPCHSPIFSSLPKSQLIIVDTPGPNEAGDNHKLSNIVISQIQKSAIVLFVLDYTNLYTEAEEEINKEVQKIIELRGSENLFVLVNKVDERSKSEKSLSTEQVKNFVVAEFGVEKQHVFEISALKAFDANLFLQGITGFDEFGQKLYENGWQRLKAVTAEKDLKQDAEQMWKDAGFTIFLHEVIYKLTTSSTHECMRTAIKTAKNCMEQLSFYPK